jgi:hypothetical protein
MKQTFKLFVAFAVSLLTLGSLQAQTAAPGWKLRVHATNVSTVSGGEALAADLQTGNLFVKSLLDPVGNNVQLARVTPSGAVTILATFGALRNSDGSGIALDPLTGGVIVADEAIPSRIALINLSTLSVSTLFAVPWVMNPLSNGTGQQQFAPDPLHPNILYFWDSTKSTLFQLDRNTNTLRQVLAIDQTTGDGLHLSTFVNDIVFDEATGTLLLSDGLSHSVLEVDPSTSPAGVKTLFPSSGAIALDGSTNTVFIATGFSIFAGPRAGGSLSLVASGFPFLTDIVVGNATAGRGHSLFAVDKRLNTVYEISRAAVPFAAFNAKVEIEGDQFEVKGSFTLGAGSNGINPPAEDVTLQIGTFSITIPAGSFRQDKKGRFTFEGTINGVALEFVIQPLGGNSFQFEAEGRGANFTGTMNPVTVTLTIGDDSGSTTVIAEFD